MHLQYGEVQRNGHEGLLAAGEKGDGLEGLPRGLGLDLDAAAQDVRLVLQLQPGLSAAEELHEGGLEALGEELELLGEDAGHLRRDLSDDLFQIRLGGLHVVPLAGEIGVAGVHPVILLDGADIGGAQGGDVPFQLPDAAGCLGHALQLNPLCLRVGVVQLVMLPEPVQNLLFLQGGGGDLLLQPGGGALQVQKVLVHLLAGPVLGSALGLQGQLLLMQGLEPGLELLAPDREGGNGLFPLGDLGGGLVDVGLIGQEGLLLLPPAPAQVPGETAQVRRPAGGGLPLGGQGRQLLLLPGDLLRQGVGPGQQLRLPVQTLLRLGAEGRGLSLLDGDLRLRLLGPPGVVRQPAGEARQLTLQIFQILPQGPQKNVKVILRALQPQHLVLGLTALALRRLQLVLGGGQLPERRLLRLSGVIHGPVHGPGAAVQFSQLRRPAQHARGAGGGAAGHGAAPVDDLAVQGDNPEGVLVFPGHGDAAVHILGNHRAAKKALEDVPVFFIKGDQAGGQPHKAELILHALLPQLAAPDGGERQEGGPAGVPLLEVVDGALGVLLPVHHDVLEPRPQGDLNGQSVLPVGLHQAGHRSVEAPEAASGLAHKLDSLGKALVLLLHLRQQADAVVQGAGVHGQLHPLLRGGGGLFLPLLHPQAVAGDDVGHGLRLVPGVLQGTAVGPGLLLRLLQLGRGGGELTLHRSLPLCNLAVLGGQGGGVRPAVGGGGHGDGLLGPQGLRLVLHSAGRLGGGPGLGQQPLQRLVQGGHGGFHLRHAGLLLLRLPLEVPGTAVRLLQLLAGTLNILLIVDNGTLQHGHGGLLLRHLSADGGGLSPDGFGFHVLFPHFLAKPLPLRI